jgi:hypothetical protein
VLEEMAPPQLNTPPPHPTPGLRILSRFNTGNIRYAELEGERCSNNAARRIFERHCDSKLWFDVTNDTWGWKDVSDGTAKIIIAEIEAKLQEVP